MTLWTSPFLDPSTNSRRKGTRAAFTPRLSEPLTGGDLYRRRRLRKTNANGASVSPSVCVYVQHMPELGIYSEYKHVLANISRSRNVNIANAPNSAQLGGTPYHSPELHPGPCNNVDNHAATDRHTDTQTRATTIDTFRVVYDSRGSVTRRHSLERKPVHI